MEHYVCNRVHLHTVRVVVLCQCSFVCVRHSIFYVCVMCCNLEVTKRPGESVKESEKE